MTTLVLIDLVLVALGSFLEWAVKDKCQTFVFFTVVGTFCALGFIGVGVAFVLGTLEMLFDARLTFTSQDWWWTTVLIVSASCLAWPGPRTPPTQAFGNAAAVRQALSRLAKAKP